jgi:hypothetical protein
MKPYAVEASLFHLQIITSLISFGVVKILMVCQIAMDNHRLRPEKALSIVRRKTSFRGIFIFRFNHIKGCS